MSFANRISQTLHDEHGATVALMERLEQMLARWRRGGPPDKAEAGVTRMLADLSTGVEAEVERHFAFEEDHIFTYLAAIGDADIGEHLASEHAAIRPIGMRVAALARGAAVNGFKPEEWAEFMRLGQELSDRMLAHVQKEEMALLPVLEENMDAETEAELYQQYVEHG
ncbi:hemerythrin domain-containing protein [Bradyrhizobium sp.]|uniref:hemerythrin domain-containing protein n=1 Tax=Bradyrhizobium sp. TaxID=376 RepID=UPI00239205F0|nr:hemerythrin domain-containing protein [Bradyrhizobium sp.]MDE2376075.1 hemerythrin domain-containing protein [Bradyrhizobium sp.]